MSPNAGAGLKIQDKGWVASATSYGSDAGRPARRGGWPSRNHVVLFVKVPARRADGPAGPRTVQPRAGQVRPQRLPNRRPLRVHPIDAFRWFIPQAEADGRVAGGRRRPGGAAPPRGSGPRPSRPWRLPRADPGMEAQGAGPQPPSRHGGASGGNWRRSRRRYSCQSTSSVWRGVFT